MREFFMRIYEDDFAYEIERVLEPATQVFKGWRYILYKIRPLEQRLSSGEAATQDKAEKVAKAELKKLQAADLDDQRKPAA
jgi:hypothetical protein